MNLAEVKQRALAEIDGLRAQMTRLSSDIHANPEIGFEEVRASEWLVEFLVSNGFNVERNVADLPTAFRARPPEREGPTLALIAEYDALPGLGHGCGHNLIGPASCAAAVAVLRAWPDAPGMVNVLGTPAEEGGGGKIMMLDHGAFEGVAASMMFHPSFRNHVNPPSLAAGSLLLHFTGRATHSAVSPHLGINAADAAMLFFAGVNALRQHVRSDARLHGVITKAGERANVIPDSSAVDFMVRADHREYMEELIARVLDIAAGAALMTGARLETERGLTYWECRRVSILGEVAGENFRALGIPLHPIDQDSAKASTDVGNVSHVLPHLAITVAIADHPIPGHSVETREAAISPFGIEAMLLAAKVLATTACDLLAEPALLDRAADELGLAVQQAAGTNLRIDASGL